MSGRQEQTVIGRTIFVFATILIVAVIGAGCKKKSSEQPHTEHQHQHNHEHDHLFELPTEGTSESAKTGTKLTADYKVSLNNIIKAARTWGPVYTSWFGKTAPDFTLTDIAGKQHKLSDYRGKDVLIIFWATWCLPCRTEIPHLIALRNTVGENKLAMLAISNENPALVKEFTADRKINYTVLSDPGTMPKPFNTITSIPCSFFIDSKGKIKLATEGLLSLGEIKAILQAE